MRQLLRMKRTMVVLLAVLAFGLSAAAATSATSINPANAPTGTHFKSGTDTCSASGTTESCTGYTLAGVGNINATANLSVTYTATVDCINGGGNPSDSQHQGAFSSTASSGPLESKNGNL